jgi:hypothetical protein
MAARLQPHVRAGGSPGTALPLARVAGDTACYERRCAVAAGIMGTAKDTGYA